MEFHLVLLLFFTPLCMINLSTNIFAETIPSIQHEQFLLLQMKHNLVFNPHKSKKLVHWNQSVDCCQWKGIACTDDDSVIGVDLSEEFITGGLDNNSSLFNLEHLQSLNLAYNDLQSPIPSNFGLLKNLRYLNLSNAGFEGQIPTEIAHLTKLATLDLSQHTLILEKPNIQMLFQNLTEITGLYLDGVKISAAGKEWSHALSSLQKLRVLSMSSCNLSGPIDSSLSNLRSLSVIQLSSNNMSSPVPESLANLSSLTTLQLSTCELTGVLPSRIFHMKKLKILDVSDNKDLGGSLPNFPQDGYLQILNLSYTNFSGQLPGAISNLKQLSTLDLSNCQFNGTLPPISFSGLTELVHLDLSLNSFNGKVPSGLFTLPSLHDLFLSHNGFDGVLEEFPNASHSTLQYIDLSLNKLQGSIPKSFFHLTSLEFLLLASNKFNGTIRLDKFLRLQNLHTLGLSHNNLFIDTTFNSGDQGLSKFPNFSFLLLASCNLKEFPTFLRNQTQLTELDLSNNQIQGMIPNWVWRMNIMTKLNLSNNFLSSVEGPFENLTFNANFVDLHSNELTGSIPIFTKLGMELDFSSNRLSLFPPNFKEYLTFTYTLTLSNNRFHGNIPQSLCNSSTLRLLDLSNNSFNGSIPKCLTSSNTLRVLNLVGNNLTGSISDTFSTLCDFRFLDLNGNLLGGTVPKSLVNCQRLEILNLGNNLLRDGFPCFLRNIPTLRVMILRSNKLHGPIACQHSTGNWKMLHIVDLASNNFTGTLPRSLLQSWPAMIHVQDSGNLFSNLFRRPDPVHENDLFTDLNKDLVKKIAKLLAGLPQKTIDHLYHYSAYFSQLQYGGAYLDSATVVSKGMQMKFVTIPAVFASLDVSSNHFEGPIPEELMSFKALIVLNLSHNVFSSHIPSSLGNLTQIESLDLSSNNLSGVIPTMIASLSFLSVLNLSSNYLVGKIPTGTQIQSFEADSFEGNEGLCGPPLTKYCSDDGIPPPPSYAASETKSSTEWNFLSAELGFTIGFGCVILPLLFWKRWRLWYSKHVDEFLCRIFPQLNFVYELHGGQNYRTLGWRRS